MTPAIDQILKDVRKKNFAPLYLLHGDETYFVDLIADEIEKIAVPEHEKGFNQFMVFGKDTQVGAVINMARRYPFMADRQLVLVKEAQQLGGLNEKASQSLLEEYAKSPLSSTILVLCHTGPYDERKALAKAIAQKGVLLNSKKLYDNKVPDWIGEYCRQQNVKISLKAIQMLFDYIGNDLKRLASEIDKIMINLKAGEEISAETVERLVGISKEYNVFELQKALTLRDVLKANRIADYFSRNPKDNPLPPMLIILYQFFTKVLMVQASRDQSEKTLSSLLGVHTFFVKDYLQTARAYPLWKVAGIIHSIRQADAFSKGIDAPSLNEGAILKQLVYEILH
ncbi:DNA polymerase III subunit delta [Larkinella knui]|uniref:DNA polymerase III subunit delta n=1 Tax=Larkinella knui TaxID=2025310 RepID=A0A3P1CXF2_9BACT|nr:DNA polymerase III subunit delta [Larkinella knui]RRB17858.1 DNA polymerase III subunit delta [Larkinella knui]